MRKTWSRWIPAAVIPALIATVALVAPFQAAASGELPDKTPEQVLALAAHPTVRAFSGTLEQSSELGLPELPKGETLSNSDAASALDLITGSHTARVYYDGPSKLRIQVLDTLAERDLVRNGSDLWLYNSRDNSALHLTLPQKNAKHRPMAGHLPQALARHFLAALDDSTRVTVGDDTTVAGRTAYDLVLTPRTDDTLIASVSIAVDSATGLPLSVDIRARGQQDPAFRLAFTSLSLTAPDADRFDFQAPPGATVTEKSLPGHRGDLKHPDSKSDRHGPSAEHEPGVHKNGDKKKDHNARGPHKLRTTGTGWSTIVELPAGSVPAEVLTSPLLGQLTTSVPGGRLLGTSLVNILLTADGRVFIGSVPLDRLQAAAR